MEPKQATSSEWEWRQPEAFRRFYQLTSNAGPVLATLIFEKSLRSLATGHYGQDGWTFKRAGLLSSSISVMKLGSDTEVATFTRGTFSGSFVAFASGARYKLRSKNFWQTEWAFEAADGTLITSVTSPSGVLHTKGRVTVNASFADLPETKIMILLNWYARLLARDDGDNSVVLSS